MTGVSILLVFIVSFPLIAAQSPPPACDSKICLLVASGRLSILRSPDFSEYKARVQRFYESTGYAFAWIRDGKVTSQAEMAIDVLQAADSKGLSPEDYDDSRWVGRLTSLSDVGNPREDEDFAEFDLALTVSVMRYISDLHFGRANPGLFRTELEIKSEFDLAGFLQQHLIHAADVKSVLQDVEPPYEGYRRTERALQRYIAMAGEVHGGVLPVTKKAVAPGDSYIAVARLTDLLRRLGDLPEDVNVPLDSSTYAGSLVDAVKHFQVRHGLDSDGRLGKATFAQLNTPIIDRVRQLQLSLERWRWAPHSFPRAPIVVNIPEFELRALNDSYETELEMRVVVGQAYHHQTPVFAADMNQVVFRPYWNVPQSIQRAELVPKLERDPTYLAKNRYEVVTPQGKVVSNGSVDQPMLAQLRSGKLSIRQIPGPENALGLVAFLFPNEDAVYLHATPATELFTKSRRDFSHGCIRAEKPQQLAAWVLRDHPDWTPERIADAMNGEKTIYVRLDKPIPVLIIYATAVALENGEVRFFADIYGQDAQLSELLAKGYPYSSVKRKDPTSAERGRRPHE